MCREVNTDLSDFGETTETRKNSWTLGHLVILGAGFSAVPGEACGGGVLVLAGEAFGGIVLVLAGEGWSLNSACRTLPPAYAIQPPTPSVPRARAKVAISSADTVLGNRLGHRIALRA